MLGSFLFDHHLLKYTGKKKKRVERIKIWITLMLNEVLHKRMCNKRIELLTLLLAIPASNADKFDKIKGNKFVEAPPIYARLYQK